MTECERSMNINLLREPVFRKLCDVLDKNNIKGWRKLGEMIASDRRLKVSSEEMELCSLKVLELEGSPSRMLLRLMGERGCTLGQLVDILQTMGQTEALKCVQPPSIQILMQPQSVAILSGHNLRLRCCAVGKTDVQYQWFKTKEEVPNSSSPDLSISPVRPVDAGFYICRVSCGDAYEFSHWAQVDVLDVAPSYEKDLDQRWPTLVLESHSPKGLVSHSLQGRLKVAIQPQAQKLFLGDRLQLECGATGRPIPRYLWHRNGVPLPNATKRKLTIQYLSMEHHGKYRCEITSDSERTWTNEVDVLVEDFYEFGPVGASEFMLNNIQEQPYATDKVALLMGNLSYRSHPQLKAPMVDVYELTNLLRQLNFKVVSLLDLTESEMRNAVDEFLLLLRKGVYGLLYYAGHGYENYGNSFMVPVDAPNPYRSANCLCVQSILKLMQDKETGLNVFLLDMCRKRNIHDDITPNIVLRVTANIVFGYATCQDAEAFELSSSGLTNGVFVKFLKKRLLDDEKITVLLDRVAEDMGQFDATKGKQALEIRSSLSERRALTDPILPGNSSDMALAHNRQWAKAHELPESMCLDFECGAKIKMGFAAEFSNVLVIYTHIVKKPADMSLCQAHVTNFSPDLDVDPKVMNRETPEDTGIYFLSSSLPQHCLYTRLGSLQKLREELVFTVCLQGSFTSLDQVVDWKTHVNIGKPLIARLDLHRAMRRNSCLQTCLMPHSPCHSPCHSPGPEHLHPSQLHPQGPSPSNLSLTPPCHSPYLDVCEASQGAAGGYCSSTQYDNVSLYQCGVTRVPAVCPPSPTSLGRPSIPIETTDDINELQTVFINSLQLHQ